MSPHEFPPFRPRLPWIGPDLQTLRNVIVPPRVDLARYESTTLTLPMRDGSGDRLVGSLHRPGTASARPLVVLVHGLSGTAESTYLLATAAALLRRRFPLVRLNLRGAGASRALCRLQYHAGRTADLRDALAGLDPALLDSGLCLVGFSLGGNMLIKFLAEHGADWPIVAAATVSAPIDLAAASVHIQLPRNRVYHRHLLRWMKEESLGAGAGISAAEQEHVRAAHSIWEFDDRFVAPRNGYRDAVHYYEENHARRFLAAVRVPTLVIHALDDPWIPPAAYRDYPWTRNPALVPLLTRGGGHVGFHGRGSREPWHDRCLTAFFERMASAQVHPWEGEPWRAAPTTGDGARHVSPSRRNAIASGRPSGLDRVVR
jgi:predicted alpha/beta-fold hydrolase